jgi:hypothetical protein
LTSRLGNIDFRTELHYNVCVQPTRRIKAVSNMKKEEDDLRPEYDLSQLLERGVRGKYAERYKEGTNVVLLEPDVAEAFPNEEAVNEALRLVMRLARIPAAGRQSVAKM